MADGFKIKYGVQRDDLTCIPNEIWDLYLPHIGGIGVLVYTFVYRLVSQRGKVDFEYMANELQLHYDDVEKAIGKLIEIELFTFSGATSSVLKINDPKDKDQFQRFMQSRQKNDTVKKHEEDLRREELEMQYQNDNVYDIAEREFGRPLRAAEYRTLASLEDDFSRELIVEAISRAVLNQAFSLQYVQSILHNWKMKGVHTMDDVQREDERFKSRRQKPSKKPGKKVSSTSKPTSDEVPYYYNIYAEREKKKLLEKEIEE